MGRKCFVDLEDFFRVNLIESGPNGLKYKSVNFLIIMLISALNTLLVPVLEQITASVRCGTEVTSLWHCWGVLEAQDALIVTNLSL